MPVVVAEHERADAQRRGGVRRRDERGHGCQLIVEVVGDRQRRVAEILHAARQRRPRPRVAARGRRGLEPEAERPGARHGGRK
jgi:hypothetical protein